MMAINATEPMPMPVTISGLIDAHGGFANIPPEMLAEYDAAMEARRLSNCEARYNSPRFNRGIV
jgi:hypothetical protein